MKRETKTSATLPEILRTLRGDDSQEVFAHKTGTSLNTYASWERGKWIPSMEGLEKVSIATGADLMELIQARRAMLAEEKPETK